jgi:hypothetical protein
MRALLMRLIRQAEQVGGFADLPGKGVREANSVGVLNRSNTFRETGR